MPRGRSRKSRSYPPEFRHQLIELIRVGCTPEELAREFEPSAQTIRNWVHQADRDRGARTDGLTSAERAELAQLRRENRRLKVERAILAKAAAWFARETGPNPHRRHSALGYLSPVEFEHVHMSAA
jgi:transposase